MVDKPSYALIYSKKEWTRGVNKPKPRVDNEMTKKIVDELSTYPRHIILIILFI